ncbi:MAG TPA: AI-2E family transporter [Myxococcota bacterium]|nr:AI-2E family transporter [Myxococcota bacterium]
MRMTGSPSNLERNLGWAVLLLLLCGCLLVLLPFIPALLWAAVLSYSSWPVYTRLLALLRERRTLAAAAMSLAMIVIILLPFVIVGATLADNVKELTTAIRHWLEAGPPAPPAWLDRVPLIGSQAAESWRNLASNTGELLERSKQWIQPVSAALLKVGLLIGGGLMQLALSIFIAFVLFREGESLARHLTSAAERIGGERGLHLLGVAGGTIRGVVDGILGTALVQAVMAGIGFVIAGVPGAMALALVLFFMSVVPMGPPLIWLPAAFWLFQHGDVGWGIFMLVWGVGVSSIDNFVKPWLISHGCKMPFILIFFGVLGGALAFGFIGVFLGPTLLAVGFRLVDEWTSSRGAPVRSAA